MSRDEIVRELGRLYDLTRKLRLECPWDRKQTQESIIAYTLEETYELSDAIQHRATQGDSVVCGELGDLLFQVYFLAAVAEESGLYDLGKVAAGIHEKLVRRHPHIFGEGAAETPDEVRETWEVIKREAEGREGIFHEVATTFPATLFAQKLQQRAAAVGFDWEHAYEVLDKLKEELWELEQEVATGGQNERVEEEVGDLLFTVINLARKLRIDPELALRRSALRFKERVEAAAAAAGADGLVFHEMELAEQEAYYQRAKKERER